MSDEQVRREAEKRARLAAALRENLKRRKAQARSSPGEEPDGGSEVSGMPESSRPPKKTAE